jgi:type I restriction enzyme S subunit
MQKLGDYIREVDVRNKDLKVTNLMGIKIDKHFMPSVANTIGTDLSNYKVVSKNQFACNLMHVGRDEKIPIAILLDENKIIVSPAYFTFEIINSELLLPEYLMMWFSRKEFDRNAWFYTDADVRGGMDKRTLMDMQLPIPSIEQQREIVSEYETISKRIKLNEQIIKNLEATAQTLYHKMFVEGIDKEKVSLKDICKIQSGFAFKSEWWQKKGVPVIKINNIHNNTIFRDECDCVSEDKAIIAYKSLVNKGDIVMALTGNVGKISIIPDNGYLVNQRVGIFKVDDVYREFLYLVLNSAEMQNAILNIGGGSVQINISPIDIGSIKIIMPSACDIRQFHKQVLPVFHTISLKQIENIKLKEIQPLLLAKMGR